MNQTMHRTSLRETRKNETRDVIIRSALRLMSRGGFSNISIASIAREAGIASGTIYLHFENRAALFLSLFELAATWEEDAIANLVVRGDASLRLRLAIRTFVVRALKGQRLAFALIAEPVDPEVERARLLSRARFARLFEKIIVAGISDGSLECKSPRIASYFIVGAITECLVEPLSSATETNSNRITNSETVCIIEELVFRALRTSK